MSMRLGDKPNKFQVRTRTLSLSQFLYTLYPGGFFANQFENLANYRIHYETTGPEIWSQTNGALDAFVMSCGES